MLDTLPVPALERIASFSSGAAMYRVALTAKNPFFSDYFQEGTPARGSVLGSRLIRIAMDGSLSRLLMQLGGEDKSTNARLDLTKLDTILRAVEGDGEGRQALVAGSVRNSAPSPARRPVSPHGPTRRQMIVQAALGAAPVNYRKSDLDIFVTHAAAPRLRAGLVSTAEFGLRGWKQGGYGDDHQSRTIENWLDHVEEWVRLPEEGSELWGSEDDWERPDYDPTLEPPTREECEEYGEEEMEHGGARTSGNVYERSGSYPRPLVDLTMADDVPLPFNWYFDYQYPGFNAVCDLVVGRRTVGNAEDLLSSFDIDICKCFYDGHGFHIEQPHRTFMGISQVNPARAALIASYLALPAGPYGRGSNSLHGTEQTISTAVFHDAQCDLNLADSADPPEQIQVGLQHHDFIARMVLRLQKYHGRGIKFTNCPDGALTEAMHVIGADWRY